MEEKEERHTQLVDSRDHEIDGLSSVVKSLQDELQKVSDDHQKEFDVKVAAMRQAHDTQMLEATEQLERVKELNQSELEKGSETLSKQLADLTESLKRKEAEYQEALEAAQNESTAQIEAIKRSRDEEIENIKKEHATQQLVFDEAIEKLKAGAVVSLDEKEKIWEQKLADVQAASAEETRALAAQVESLNSDSQKGYFEVDSLKATLAALNNDVTVNPFIRWFMHQY